MTNFSLPVSFPPPSHHHSHLTPAFLFSSLLSGYLGPGGVALLQNGTSSPQCIGGAAGEVDRWLLTSSHIYQNPTTKTVYGSAAFDPEGVLGEAFII